MLKITVIPALRDNYIYIVDVDSQAVVVDPGEAAPVMAALAAADLSLRAILLTHRHDDHIGGVAELRAANPDVAVYAPQHGGVAAATVCAAADNLSLLQGALSLRVLATPGHTAEHISFVGEDFVFCGDTLFVGGCGRVFDGTMQQMHDSLMSLAALPDHTRVYCGHEYTQANYRFARAVEPTNAALSQRAAQVEAALARGEPSVPTTIGEEKECNPFLRLTEATVFQAASEKADTALSDSVAVFTALRRWKDSF